MRTGTRRLATAAAALTLTVAATLGAAVPANATGKLGTRSLATVLAADGDKFDRNWNDYDVLTQAVGAVLAAKPNSPVAVLADGKAALTAFLPSDRAFRSLAADLTGHWYRSEQELFTALAKLLGVDTIEAVLLYHVVPGATIDSKTALKSDGAKLTTALPGGSLTVDVLSKRYRLVRLIDADRTDADPWLNPWALDINRGNRQIAHGVLLVLRPLDI
ncbi:fasciclin domain-containing protein [Kribbella sp. CA-293567]|uniref:fasciclin domain-containing protein n=1 Tax=Kribbella sp. CA-293567 TaxID=3002436 RepID=UPI0022DD241A|nr:fasciclin domain-containing protein [Kribbella sp. CA-293567]WBQ03480.1 fasciclin domain-containing protein [Kribbella sp. CA-293567]